MWLGFRVRTWRLVGTWAAFVGLAVLLRPFLTLLFLTFILSYAINSLVSYLCGRTGWAWRKIVVLVYLFLGGLAFAVGMIIVPRAYHEGQALSHELPVAKENLLAYVRDIMENEEFKGFADSERLEEAVRDYSGVALQTGANFMKTLVQTSFHFLLSLIFSFLILWDLDRLVLDVRSLASSRLRHQYNIVAPKLQQFGAIVGKAFEAQIVIAIVNTALTLLGLLVLGMPNVLFLSVFVFICSFIPVLGVFISSVPICLLAFKKAGLWLAFECVILIAIIHFIEAYILNPRIVGAHLSTHPFIAVCILVISEYFIGIWGLLLGVPLAVFFYRSFVADDRHEPPATPPLPASAI